MNAAVKRLMRAGNGLAVFLYRRSNGRIGGTARGGTRVLLLTVPGRKSGTPHARDRPGPGAVLRPVRGRIDGDWSMWSGPDVASLVPPAEGVRQCIERLGAIWQEGAV